MTQLNNEEIRRYSRHLMLPEIGASGQGRLKASKILCVGAGGLGSPILLYLAAAGVGRIGIVDFDTVDLTNLQRQIAHGNADLGRPKTESARDAILAINPHVAVDVHTVRLARENAVDIIQPYDVIIDGTDNFAARYLLHDAGFFLGKPCVYGAVFRFEGQASVFTPAQGGPCYRCLFPQPPPPGLAPSCAEAGVIGVLPGVIGCIQATEAIKIVTSIGQTLSGRLLVYDALQMRFRELKVRRDPGCPLCGDNRSIHGLEDVHSQCEMPPTPDYPDLEAGMDALKRVLADQNPSARVIDIREARERDAIPVPGAWPYAASSLPESIDEWNKDLPIYVICQAGVRSLSVVRLLRGRGFKHAHSIRGGLRDW
jgi:adenylyltransferase/sulfurtransferase